jgi:hypothetical protein
MSTPRTRSRSPSTPSSFTTLSPMGFGRYGALVASTPRRRSLRGGSTLGLHPSFRSNTKITHR